MAKASAPDRSAAWANPLSDRSVSRYAAVALCLPLLFLQTAEVVTRLGNSPISWANVTRLSVGVLSSGVGLTSLMVMRMGWRGLAFTAISLLATVHIMVSYRGTFVWPGTFDLFEVTRWRWLGYPLAAALVGAVGGAILYRGKPRECPARIAYVAVAMGFTGAAWSWLIAARRVAEPTSEFAPTRHMAYLVVSILCLSLVKYVEVAEGG